MTTSSPSVRHRTIRHHRTSSVGDSTNHQDWLGLVDIEGPFLSMPILSSTWRHLDALDEQMRPRLRAAHSDWRLDHGEGRQAWIRFVLRDLLAWGSDLHMNPSELERFAFTAEHGTILTPDFLLADPHPGPDAKQALLLGLVFPDGTLPNARIGGSAWAATPVDRMAKLCRRHRVELGLVSDGRWWALVWAPHDGTTTSAVFDAITWPEAADRIVVRAFYSLLRRKRFVQVPEEERLIALLQASLSEQEALTDALGVQVRQAVELLVEAIGRADAGLRGRGGPGLSAIAAHDVYRGAVTVLMRIVYLLYAEEHGLLPSDNDVYRNMYSVGRLCEQLEYRVRESSEEELEHSTAGWHRLLALFRGVYQGINHPQLKIHGYDGSIFDPDGFPWLEGRLSGETAVDDLEALPLAIDDRTVFHMLRAVQYVEVGTGRRRERRRLAFRTLSVEEISFVYEGLLSYGGLRASDDVVGLVGKAGLEEEVELGELEALARPFQRGATMDTAGFAEKLSAEYKKSGVGSAGTVARRLAPLAEVDRMEATRKLYAATGDPDLVRRLLPFYGLIRTDLRGLPVVIRRGGLYVTESRQRKATGAHYTPRRLAEEVVHHAIEPLVYSPGPLTTADETKWKLRHSDEILKLKIADISAGSGTFLVAACRYLAARLIEAWSAEGDSKASMFTIDAERPRIDIENDPVMLDAKRKVIENCLYGIDINPMAVEIAKLSLWLISTDPTKPFVFLDDRLVAGDSLLGITSLEQIEVMDLDVARGRRVHKRGLLDLTVDVHEHARALVAKRAAVAAVEATDLAALTRKRVMLADARQESSTVFLLADLATGVGLATAGRSAAFKREYSLGAAVLAQKVAAGNVMAVAEAVQWCRLMLATDKPVDAFDRVPLHWPLEFPEVFVHGGFDAVIGNPPFLGGQRLTGSLGIAYREYIVEAIGLGARGSADLVAYMALRSHRLLNPGGQTGLIATNTLAQGDTREVGLDQIAADGATIRRAVKSARWPSKSAMLEYSVVWTSRAPLGPAAARLADDIAVATISTSLESGGRISGKPQGLEANDGIAFQGSIILGLGFTMSAEHARALIEADQRNREILFPYLNGQDLNTNPDCKGSRWVIDFHNWTEEAARSYKKCYEQVRLLVKPERDKANRAARRDRWWQFAERSAGLYRAIAGLDQVIALARISKTVMPVLVPTGQVFNEKTVIFATNDPAMLALLSSAPHYWWAISHSSTLKTDLNYSPTDVFETFARPDLTSELRNLGDRLDTYRRELMLKRQSGLTKTYNLLHDATITAPDIAELRAIHRDIDYAVARAYGWHDLAAEGTLDHGFHDTRQGPRYTVGPVVRQEILDRLLELNHERHRLEAARTPKQLALVETPD